MNLKNFNQLSQKERLEIFLNLKEKFSEENLNYFFTQINIPDNRRDLEYLIPENQLNYVLSPQFNSSEWNNFLNFFDYQKISPYKKETLKDIISSLESITNIIETFNKQNNCFIIDLKIFGSAIADLIFLDKPSIEILDLSLEYRYKPYLLRQGFTYDRRNHEKDCQLLISEIEIENKKLQNKNKSKFNYSEINEETELHGLAKDFLFHIVHQYLNEKIKIIGNENLSAHFFKEICVIDEQFKHSINLYISPKFMRAYEKKIDFTILGLAIPIVNQEIDLFEDMSKVESNFYKNIVIPYTLHKDITEKVLSFDVDDFSEDEIESIMNNHYPILKNKYPELQLQLISRFNHPKEYLEKLMLTEELRLNNKNDLEKNYKKVKI